MHCCFKGEEYTKYKILGGLNRNTKQNGFCLYEYVYIQCIVYLPLFFNNKQIPTKYVCLYLPFFTHTRQMLQ